MATCPVCKTDQIPVKKDGDLYKHVRSDGERCDNISTTLEVKNNTGKSESVLDKDQSEEYAEFVTNVISEADLPKEKTFKFTLTLTLPATYINDSTWHQSNKELAESRARRAGMTPTGAPRYEGAVERGRKVVLTYEVPVK